MSGSNGVYTGSGFISVPYLENIKIEVNFKDITINTSYQLIKGVVETSYDASEKNVVGIDPIIASIFGPKPAEETPTETESNTTISENEGKAESSITDVTSSTKVDTTISSSTTTPINIPIGTNTNQGTTAQESSTQTTTANAPSTNNATANTNTSQETTGTNSTGKDYYIEYKNKKYYTGAKIKIPYSRYMQETFEMKPLASDTKVSYSIYEPGKIEIWRGYDSSTAKSDLPIEDTGNVANLRVFDLMSQATSLEGKPKVVVEVEKIVSPFDLTGLTVKDKNNTARIAKAGETLYFINKPLKTDSRSVIYEQTISPNLKLDKIPSDFIKWAVADHEIPSYSGRLLIDDKNNYVTDLIPDFKVTATTGFPTLGTKSVNVKWVDEDKEKYQVVPPVIQTTAETIFNDLTKLNNILSKLGLNKVLEIKPKINVSGAQFIEEDDKTSHYKIVREGEINASVEAKTTFTAPPPYSRNVKIPFTDVTVVDYELYLAFKFNIGVQGKLRYEKRDDSEKFMNKINSICIKGSGGIEPGLKLDILPRKENLISLNGKAYGKADLTVSGCYDITNGKFEPKVYFDPLIVGVNLNVKVGGISIVDTSYELTLSDRVKIYGK